MSEKESLLRSIAETGYDIGIGAKRHLKSFDILRIAPLTISIIVIIIGVFQMTEVYKYFSKLHSAYFDVLSALLIVIGILGLVADLCSDKKEQYMESGTELITLLTELRSMYNKVKGINGQEINCVEYYSALNEIQKKAKKVSIAQQIVFSGLFAHLGFFGGEVQIGWMDEQLHFRFKDKFPVSFFSTMIVIVIFIAIIFFACTGYEEYLQVTKGVDYGRCIKGN